MLNNALLIELKRLFKLYREISSGFTFLELMTVVAIIATLAGIAIPVYSIQIEKAKITKAIAEIRMLEKVIATFRLEPGSPSTVTPEETETSKKGKGKKNTESEETVKNDFPNTLTDIGYGELLDPWGSPYQFANHANISPGKRRKYKSTVPLNTDYDLYSMGPDGKTVAPITSKAGYDDIIRASDGLYIGLASQY